MSTTYVVAREGKGNWVVTDNDGSETTGFRNWVVAIDHARELAVSAEALVVRLSAKDGAIVEYIKPRVSVTSRTKKASAETTEEVETVVVDEVVEPDSTVEFVDELVAEEESNETLTEADLLALGTGDLVAIYNNVGGNITGKFKGARKDLVKKILANQAA